MPLPLPLPLPPLQPPTKMGRGKDARDVEREGGCVCLSLSLFLPDRILRMLHYPTALSFPHIPQHYRNLLLLPLGIWRFLKRKKNFPEESHFVKTILSKIKTDFPPLRFQSRAFVCSKLRKFSPSSPPSYFSDQSTFAAKCYFSVSRRKY